MLLALLLPCRLYAQVDTAYIATFPQKIAIGGLCYYDFMMLDYEIPDGEKISYMPNSPVSLGLSIDYKGWSISGGYGFDFMRDKEHGRTKILDLQTHYYGRKFILDFYFQDYQGLYTQGDDKDAISLYPDIKILQYGLCWQYVFNYRKFSYRAAFNQSERQLKSAGSFQAGGGMYYNYASSDSSLAMNGKASLESYQLSITGGYVYTWVVKKNFHVSLGTSVGINLATESLKNLGGNKIQVLSNVLPRFAAGYDAETWSIGLSGTLNIMSVAEYDNLKIGFNTGHMGMFFIKRLEIDSKYVKKKP